MRAIARAHKARNLADFEKARREYNKGSYQTIHAIALLFTHDPPFLLQ